MNAGTRCIYIICTHNNLHIHIVDFYYSVKLVSYFFGCGSRIYLVTFLRLECVQVLALVGDQLDYGDNICGAVLSIRFNEDIVSVWNRNASDHQV